MTAMIALNPAYWFSENLNEGFFSVCRRTRFPKTGTAPKMTYNELEVVSINGSAGTKAELDVWDIPI